MISSLKKLEWRFRAFRKGYLHLNAVDQECLRGTHQGETLLVHGNGPSCYTGYEFASNRFGEKVVVLGMNASLNIIKPNYYVLVDRSATIRYLEKISDIECPLLVSQNALKKATHEYRKNNPDLYHSLGTIVRKSNTVKLERSSSHAICPKMTFLPGSMANAGIVSTCLALMMLLPKLSPAGDWVNPIKPGRLLVTGLDGYDLGKRVKHIDPKSPPPDDPLSANLWQSSFMIQLFSLALFYGIEVWNLSLSGNMPVNDLCRNPEFDSFVG